MATFVITHGAWGGGWSWTFVRPLLRAAGHEVFTPTLTGLGERAHLVSPQVNLDTHINDIAGVLEYENLRDVILVGHSYGGMVITGVAGRVADRLAHLVYVDAFVPETGECLMDLIGPADAARFEELARTQGAGWLVPPALPVSPAMPPPDRRRPHPIACFRQPATVDAGAVSRLPRTYIYCNDPPLGSFDRFAARVRAEPGWHFFELETGHNPQYTMPRELTELLLTAVP